MKPWIFLLFGVALLTGCSSSKKNIATTHSSVIREIKFLSEYVVPNGMIFNGTVVGGLSGIDYDEKSGHYYLICDDRSEINPARFYTAKISLKSNWIDTVEFLDVDTLKNSNGRTYSPNTTDPEALRFNPLTKQLIWTSEGERITTKEREFLQDPAITIIDTFGNFQDSVAIPGNMHMSAEEKGPRRNGVFEGLTFADNYKTLFVSVEEPIYEDGPRAGINDSAGLVRFLKFDLATKKQTAQFGYQIDPVIHAPVPVTAFKINGIPDILSIGENQFLVIERSFSTGFPPSNIRIYLADATEASDVSSINSLQSRQDVKLIKKMLLFNMDTLNRYIDNVEGVSFGPVLPNGHRSLIFVADDNFSKKEKMQFFLFEVNPD